MLFYLSIFIFLFFASLLEVVSNNKKYSIITSSFTIIIFFILSFIRWDTGTDWDSYYNIYTWIRKPWDNLFNLGMEPGYEFVMHLGKFLFGNYTGVLFILSNIIYFFLFKTYTTFSKYPVTSILLSFCIISFAHILYVRQNVAVVILGWSIYYVIEKNILKFALCVLFASLFHRTAFVFFIVYFIYYKEFSFSFIVLVILGSLTFGTLLNKMLLSLIGGGDLGIISNKINMYMEAGTDENTTTLSTTTILIKGFINRSVLIILFFYCKYKLNYNNTFFNGFLNIYILGTVLYFITLPINITLARIAVYMDILQVILIPYIIYQQKNIYNRLILFSVISLYFYIRFYSTFISYEYEYVPFKTIFSL